jgi:hypothetical protein
MTAASGSYYAPSSVRCVPPLLVQQCEAGNGGAEPHVPETVCEDQETIAATQWANPGAYEQTP